MIKDLLTLTLEEVGPVVAIIVGYILAQGWADSGKEAAKMLDKPKGGG